MAKRGQKLRKRSSKKKTHRGKRVTHRMRTQKPAKKRSTRKRRHTFPRLTRTKKLRRMKGGGVMLSQPPLSPFCEDNNVVGNALPESC